MGYCIRCKSTVLVNQKWVKLITGFYHLDCYNRLVTRNKKIFIIFGSICSLIFTASTTIVLIFTL